MRIWEEIKYRVLQNQNALNQLLLINILAFGVVSLFKLILFFFNQTPVADAIVNYLYVPGDLKTLLFHFWTPITYQFMHTGVFHILFNMLMFYFMGTLIQDFLGSRKLYTIYLWGGVIAASVFVLSYNIFPVFAEQRSLGYLVGASGSVMAVTAAAATLLPHYEVYLFGVVRVKLKWLALGLILIDVAGIPSGNPGGGIAHLGGAMFGLFYIIHIKGLVNNPVSNFFNSISKILTRPANTPDERKIYREKVYSQNENKKANQRREPKNSGKPNQAEIDAILDKISHSGYDSLTSSEKELLFRASE
jgi:membrane associated rhomboid family serine protease